MKLITRDTDYAVSALLAIERRKGEITAVTDLQKELGIRRPILRKLLQQLHHAGYLKAYKGRGGGFVLNKPAGKIGITGLMEVFQGPFSLNECVRHKKPCTLVKQCVLRKKVLSLEAAVWRGLKGLTLEDLAFEQGDL